ncbi:MAG TPA: acylase [Myxococcales bacterium]|nr:acylase [Myxococcales bacterium]
MVFSGLSRARKTAVVAASCAALLAGWTCTRSLLLRSPVPPLSAAQHEQAARVRILRDSFGVPHVFGKTDADAAFGLAYAHAEDDWPTLQDVLAAARGRLGLLHASTTAAENDYYAQLIDVAGQVETQYPALSPEVRRVLDGYAEGLNAYAALHPSQADGRLLPITARDVAAGFAHKLPVLFGLPGVLRVLGGKGPLHAGDELAWLGTSPGLAAGSNAHAVLARRSTDGVTRLNVNSHQPWAGPVAWYEGQVVSEEGWNMTGGLFPGAPVVLLGHNETLGWAHTVNQPHLIDVFELRMNPESPHEYRFDDRWVPLGERDARLELDLGVFLLPLHKKVYRSVHGPVIETSHGFYAIRYAGIDRALRAVEQWYRMDKARNLAEWKAAMEVQGIPMFNTVYADRNNILYVYNALIPVRSGAADPSLILPGDRADALWSEYLTFARLPQVENPPSGFVFNCNTTPFQVTDGPGNPSPSYFPASAGIERTMNNRGLRSLALFGGAAPISREEFFRFKFDRVYGRGSPMIEQVVAPLVESFTPRTDDERRALALLRAWDGAAEEDSTAAALAILTEGALFETATRSARPSLAEAFRGAIAFLVAGYGRVAVPLGEVQRLRRGSVDLPLGGAPDVLNAVSSKKDGKHLVGTEGDSYVLIAEFGPGGVSSQSIQPYGASNRPGSAHYADQAPLFVQRTLKPTWRTREDLRAHLSLEYSPGEELSRHR